MLLEDARVISTVFRYEALANKQDITIRGSLPLMPRGKSIACIRSSKEDGQINSSR